MKKAKINSYEYFRKSVRLTDENGNTIYKSVYAKTQKELRNKIDEITLQNEIKISQKKYPSFSDVADNWNEEHSASVSYYTYECYQAPLKDLKKEFNSIQIGEISSLDIQKYLNTLAKKGYAKQTINLRKIAASQIFDFAILKNIIKFNPCSAVKLPKSAHKNKRELPAEEDIEKVKKNVNAPFGLFAYFVLYTGCRRGEALALNYEDIDFDNEQININKVAVFENGKTKIENRAKSVSGVRTIPLLSPLKSVLDRNKKGLIFSSNGSLMTLSEFNCAWKKYRREANIDLTPHQLRHAFATICYDAGLEAKDASAILGHSKVELTLDIYTHIKNSRAAQSAKKLNDFLS